MSLTTMLGSLAFWVDINRYVDRPTWHFYQFKPTTKAIATLMIPQIATQIYTSLDKPILGLFSGATQVAFYDNSQRISNMILGVITSISIVLMPKMAAQGKRDQQLVLKKSLEVTVMLGSLFAVIVMANTAAFVPFFFGAKFIPMTPLMAYFSLTIILIPVGGVFANQYALANKLDKEYAIPVVIGAILELLLAVLLDGTYGATGAMVAILVTEVVVMVLRIWIVRSGYHFRQLFHDVPYYLLIAAVTLVVGLFWPAFFQIAVLNLGLRTVVMLVCYLGLMWCCPLDFNHDVTQFIGKIRRRVQR